MHYDIGRKDRHAMQHSISIKTTLGLIKLSETDGFITRLSFIKDTPPTTSGPQPPILNEAGKQLREYLAGKRKTFDLPLAAEGTSFQKSVWKALRQIPYGETRSYKEVAEMIGSPKAFRAVGMANNQNPILIMIPCHRVIGANGKLTGYAAGLAIKEELLQLEQTPDHY
jgi:methylated-DNA-[protein]-cysteine S-methyltransferase